MGLSTTYTKTETDFLIQQLEKKTASGYKGDLTKSDPAPTQIGFYGLLETGTYTNLGGINAPIGKLNFASFDGTTWSLISVALSNFEVSTVFKGVLETDNDLNAITGQLNGHWYKINNSASNGGNSVIVVWDGTDWIVTSVEDPLIINDLKLNINKVVTNIFLNINDDGTNAIQTALNKKGLVRVYCPGVFVCGKLLIDSDTTLEIMPGATIKKKNLTNHCIVVNKGHTLGVRNKNITIRGGTWDLNGAGQTSSGNLSTDPQSWGLNGILMKGVDNLVIEDIQEIGNELKYCFLITDINFGTFKNINCVNESDGLHFQPPLNNILIDGIKGVTHDDLISFTMGDYPTYSLGQTGNVENVICRNVYANEGTDEIIKLVGSGINGDSVFKNMLFQNIGGHATVYGVYIMKEDQASPNPTLQNTMLENVVFENINIKVTNNFSVFAIGGASGDITIKNLTSNRLNCNRTIIFTKCNLDKVVLENINVVASSSPETVGYFVRFDGLASSSIKNLIIKDSNVSFNNATASYFIYQTGESVKNVFIENVNFTGNAAQFIYNDGTNTNGSKFFINNSSINCAIFLATFGKNTININNSYTNCITRFIHFYDNGNVRVLGSLHCANVTINGLNAQRTLSINGLETNISPTSLTPLSGDSVYYNSSTDAKNKGEYQYNGVSWDKKNSVISFNATVTAGTIAANSVSVFTINRSNIGSNRIVMCTPQFELPVGTSFSVENREIDKIKLRIINSTTSPIVFDGATQITWSLKVITDTLYY